MAKKSAKPRDVNSMAARIVAQATDPDDRGDDPYDGKDAAMVDLGKLGGAKGGKARAESLTPEQRSDIARKAAATRWTKES